MQLVRLIILLLLKTSMPFMCAYAGVMQMSGDEIRESAGKKCMSYSGADGFSYSNARASIDYSEWTQLAVVHQGKKVKFQWSTLGLVSKPRKYLLLVRLDPRFTRPVVYIQKYDYDKAAYISDFHTTLDGRLDDLNTASDSEIQERARVFDDYVNFRNRSSININRGDVVNINLVTAEKFFASNAGFSNGEMLSKTQRLLNMYTDIGDWSDNKFIYSTAERFCDFLTEYAPDTPNYCVTDQHSGDMTYLLPADDYSLWLGSVRKLPLLNNAGAIKECGPGWQDQYNSLSFDGQKTNKLCKLSEGAGLQISVANSAIKHAEDKMLPLPDSQLPNLYYNADRSGALDFSSIIPLSELQSSDYNINALYFNSINDDFPYINNYILLQNLFTQRASEGRGISFQKIAIGRAFYEVVIGRGNTSLSDTQNSNVEIEYQFKEGTGKPGADTHGTITSDNTTSLNSPVNGTLWVRALSGSDEVSGALMVNAASYSGHGVVADGLYNKVLEPLLDKFNRVTRLMYISLTHDTRLQIIARTCLTLYIVIYALFFLAGAVQISFSDLVTRAVKIIIIVAMFQPYSWNFFHDNAFVMFMDGAAQLMSRVNGTTSSINNPFGFIDPVIDRYTNPDFWALIGSQLLVFKHGIALATIFVIIAIVIFFLGVLEVIVSYLMAMVAIAVMITLAPILIIFMLFSVTRGIFDNWMSLGFNYLIQPTVLLAFFLLLDGLMDKQLSHVVIEACLGHEPVKLYIDLRHMGIDTTFDIPLPFFELIPRYVPQIIESTSTSSVREVMDAASGGKTAVAMMLAALLMFSYGLMSLNLLGYANTVNAQLTSTPGGINTAPTASISGDISGATGMAVGAAGVVGLSAAGGVLAVGAGAATLAVGGAVTVGASTARGVLGGGVSGGARTSRRLSAFTGNAALNNMKRVNKLTSTIVSKGAMGLMVRSLARSETFATKKRIKMLQGAQKVVQDVGVAQLAAVGAVKGGMAAVSGAKSAWKGAKLSGRIAKGVLVYTFEDTIKAGKWVARNAPKAYTNMQALSYGSNAAVDMGRGASTDIGRGAPTELSPNSRMMARGVYPGAETAPKQKIGHNWSTGSTTSYDVTSSLSFMAALMITQ